MPRVKRGVMHTKTRRNILKKAKGYKWGRKNLIKRAKTAVVKAGAYARRDRRVKKSVARALWNVQLNAALAKHEISYSKFIGAMKKANITLDRKVMTEIAKKYPATFDAIVNKVK